MQKALKLMAIILVALISLSPIFATGSKETESNEGVTTIQFASWGIIEESTKAAFEAMIADFEAKNPDIKIENLGIPYNQFFEQLLILNAGGTPPDVAMIHEIWVGALENAGALADLNPLLSDETKADFFPQVKENCTYDGKLVVAPWSPSPTVLFYNKTLLKKAGYTEPPKTMDELFEMAEAVSALGSDENGNTIYGLGIQSKKLVNTGFYFLPYLWNYGGELALEDGTVVIDSQSTVDALAAVKDLFDKKITPEGLEIKDVRNLFANGTLGFHLDGDMGYITFLTLSPKGNAFAEEIGIAPVPGENTGFFNAHTLGIFEKSQKKEAAARFIEYLTGPEGMAVYNEYGGNKTPGRYSVEEIPFYSAEGNEHMRKFIDILKVSRAMPDHNPGFVAAMEEVAEGVQRVGINHEDPQTVTKEMAAKINKIYSEY